MLAAALSDAPAPFFLIPGNHDDHDRLRAAFPEQTYAPRSGPMSYVLENLPVRIIAIDQIAPGCTHGVFTAECVAWLDSALAAAPEKPTMLALHHPPFATHDLLFDGIGLHGADRFAQVVARHRQVLRIVCGHHHRLVVGQVAHAPVVIAPSTSWAYGLALHEGDRLAPKTGEQPGWVLHAWTAQAGLASHFMGL